MNYDFKKEKFFIKDIDGSYRNPFTGEVKTEMQVFLEKKDTGIPLPKCWVFGCRVKENGEHSKRQKT